MTQISERYFELLDKLRKILDEADDLKTLQTFNFKYKNEIEEMKKFQEEYKYAVGISWIRNSYENARQRILKNKSDNNYK